MITQTNRERASGTIILAARNDPKFRAAWLVDPAGAIQLLEIDPPALKADLINRARVAGGHPAASLAWLTGSEVALGAFFAKQKTAPAHDE